ncbi:peptidylprolyl isomerase [Aerosakkonemataceae cyanobacterium BLCC-F154]|uniref:peptidylprolyl isomerase n=1 Tax=Floridaenema fluviatile BLCC-F154 TaxID=3153640 RepID=A0ABV4Y557_9CYAN
MANLAQVIPEPNEIIQFLKQEMLLKDISEKILHQKIISKTAQERGIVITPEEIQEEADLLRREKRLEKASDTLAWLADQLISAEDLEARIHQKLLTKKLSTYLFDKEVEKYFAEHKLDFEQFTIYQIVVSYEQLAQEIFYEIEEEEISFYEAAHFYDIDQRRRYYCGYEGKMYRWSLNPDIASVVFSAPIGEIIGPLKTEQGYHLFMVQEFIQAELTPETHQSIINKLFRQWLEGEFNYWLHNSCAVEAS